MVGPMARDLPVLANFDVDVSGFGAKISSRRISRYRSLLSRRRSGLMHLQPSLFRPKQSYPLAHQRH